MVEAVRTHPFVAFLALTVGFSWTVWTLGIVVFDVVVPAVLLGAWGPTVAAVVVTYARGGRRAIRALLARFDPRRTRAGWYVVAVLVPFLAAGLALGAFLATGGTHDVGLPRGLPAVVLPVVLLVNVFVGGALAEEAGWRGFLLPELHPLFGTPVAGALVGVTWAVWHLPLYALPGAGLAVGGFPFAWFLPVVVGYSLVLAWLADRTGDALVPAVLFHAATNTAAGLLALVPVDEPLALGAYVLVLWGPGLGLAVLVGRSAPAAPAGDADPTD
jgi:membrane protease YdiL (CAAX protease family)